MHRSRTAFLIAVTVALAWVSLAPPCQAARGFIGLPRSGYATPTGDADQYTGVVHHRVKVPTQPSTATQHLVRTARSIRVERLIMAVGLARTIFGAYGAIYLEQ